MPHVDASCRCAALLVAMSMASASQPAQAGATTCDAQSVPVVQRNAGRASFTWQALPTVPAAAPAPHAYRIAVSGDSLTSARSFIDAALQAAGISPSSVAPSFSPIAASPAAPARIR